MEVDNSKGRMPRERHKKTEEETIPDCRANGLVYISHLSWGKGSKVQHSNFIYCIQYTVADDACIRGWIHAVKFGSKNTTSILVGL
jgi:hypothetical protein